MGHASPHSPYGKPPPDVSKEGRTSLRAPVGRDARLVRPFYSHFYVLAGFKKADARAVRPCMRPPRGYVFFKMRWAPSANTTTAPARIAGSLITKRPAPVNNGKPCSPLPKSGTQHSGVVTRKESVPKVINMTSPDPTKPILGNQMPKSVKMPNDMMSKPKPCEKPYVLFSWFHSCFTLSNSPSFSL